jgi:hypothetical protein
MRTEREFLIGSAMAIGLAIVPLTGWIYWCLEVVLAALCARLAYLSFKSAWTKVLGGVLAVAVVAAILTPHTARSDALSIRVRDESFLSRLSGSYKWPRCCESAIHVINAKSQISIPQRIDGLDRRL